MKYINADDLELEVSHYLQCEKESESITLEELKEITNRLPSADAVEVKHGHWIENENGTYSCSLCHACIPREQYYYDARKCIHCGADMRGENKSE